MPSNLFTMASIADGTGGNASFNGGSLAKALLGPIDELMPVIGALVVWGIALLGIRMIIANMFGDARSMAQIGPQFLYLFLGVIICHNCRNIAMLFANTAQAGSATAMFNPTVINQLVTNVLIH